MKIKIIHGDNNLLSYKILLKTLDEFKSKNYRVEKITKDSKLGLQEIISSQSLFKENIIYLIEDIKLIKTKDWNWIKSSSSNTEGVLVIYSDTLINKTLLNKFPKGTNIEEFKLPILIWKFLDSFYPKNSKVSLAFLHQISINEPIEFIFSLLGKTLRDLYWVKNDPVGLPYPGWRVGKLKNQASKFGETLLKEIIIELAKIDIKVKTSKADLLESLDFLIITKLE